MPVVSSTAPQIELATVVSVDDESPSGRDQTDDVFDIAVEGNHNFFAGGVLVHNCSDDPHNAHEVYSEPKRKSVHSKWDNELFSRVNDNTRSIRTIVMQRLHVDDLTAHVFAEVLQGWMSISLALEYDGHPPIAPQEKKRRKEAGDDRVGTWLGWSDPRAAPNWTRGPILHPIRFPSVIVAQLKVRRLVWASQFQQRPEKLEGGMFPATAWKFWLPSGSPTPTRPRPDGCLSREELPARIVPRDKLGRLLFDWVDLSVDATFKKTEDGSRVAILAIGGIGPDRFVIYDSSKRRDYPETKKAIRALVNADGAKIDPFSTPLDGARWRMTKVLIEDKANGSAAIQELKTSSDGGKWPGGVAIFAIETGDENYVSRAAVMSDAVQGGQWYLLDGATWLDSSCGDEDDLGFVAEFQPFPGGDRDDRVDAGSQCANYEMTNVAAWRDVDWNS